VCCFLLILQVCKWLGLALALLQLLTLLLSCWLQAAYVRAEEAAEDADEEAAWHRRPLLQAQAARWVGACRGDVNVGELWQAAKPANA
jgi:hypothetical protein